MGNEALRASRSTTFRRSSRQSRRSQKSSSGGGQQYIAEDEMDTGANNNNNNNNLELTPKPARRMDKIRRSLSFRRKKKSASENNIQSAGSQTVGKSTKLEALSSNSTSGVKKTTTDSAATTMGTATNSTANNTSSTPVVTTANTTTNGGGETTGQVARPALWVEDERRVRAGNCSFQVKYLGFQEVSDSRGMHICEQAIEKLIALTLLVDQTIEKVSFCAPDRHHESGFAYICRDGTARRWLCHGFLAVKDTLKAASPGSTGGERLSHAVGCAFSVCLEKKQKRERENVSMEHGPMHSFARLGSFRQASLTERFDDPQAVMPKIDPVPIRSVDNPHAIERPKPSADVFRRGESGRGTMLMSQPSGFKRNQAAYASLKPGELPSFQQQREKSGFNVSNGIADTKTAMLTNNKQQYQNMTLNELANGVNATPDVMTKSDTFNKINTINEIPEEHLLESPPPSSHTNPLQPTIVNKEQTNHHQLANQLTTHLNIEPPPEWSQPAVVVQVTTQPQQQQQQTPQYYQSSIFATPQSIPATPTLNPNPVTPPPLPPMPQHVMAPPPTPATIMSTMPTNNIYQYNTQYPLNNSIYLASPSTTSLGNSVPQAAIAGSSNETFEQKWARYQAAKKQTNPFAEDIAKKYEIKL